MPGFGRSFGNRQLCDFCGTASKSSPEQFFLALPVVLPWNVVLRSILHFGRITYTWNLFITFQRYVTICRSGSAIDRWLNSGHRWIIVCVHWILPFAYVMPIIGRDPIKFASPENMGMRPSQLQLKAANTMSFVFVCISFFLCCLCYWRIFLLLHRHRLRTNISSQGQNGVIVQLTGLILAFTLTAVNRLIRACHSFNIGEGMLKMVKLTQPLVTGILSIVNPWMMLLTATDLRRNLCDFYGIRKVTVLSSSSVIAIKLSKSQNANLHSRVFHRKKRSKRNAMIKRNAVP